MHSQTHNLGSDSFLTLLLSGIDFHYDLFFIVTISRIINDWGLPSSYGSWLGPFSCRTPQIQHTTMIPHNKTLHICPLNSSHQSGASSNKITITPAGSSTGAFESFDCPNVVVLVSTEGVEGIFAYSSLSPFCCIEYFLLSRRQVISFWPSYLTNSQYIHS